MHFELLIQFRQFFNDSLFGEEKEFLIVLKCLGTTQIVECSSLWEHGEKHLARLPME